MHRCPKCGSFNSRKSFLRVSKDTSRVPFTVWFRCRDCRNRFQGTNWALVGQWVPFVGTIAIALWLIFSGHTPPLEIRADPLSSSAPSQTTLLDSELVQATDALTTAAENGDPDAQYSLGYALFREYLEQESREALLAARRWLTEAAEQGHTRAQLQLGKMYEKGRGVIQDNVVAFEWFRQAAEQGEAEAMLWLGRMYEGEHGIPKDLITAYVWLNLAAARGETKAEVHRDMVRLRIPDKITDAQKRSRILDREIPHQE